MDQSPFHSAISILLGQLGLDGAKAGSEDGDFYTVSIGPVEIELVGSQEGFINFLCFPGDLPSLTIESLSALLAANRYQEADPVISVSLLDTAPPKVSIWSRLSLHQATPEMLGDLFVRFTELSHAVQNWINVGAPGLKSDGSTETPDKQDRPSSTMRRFQIKGKSSARP